MIYDLDAHAAEIYDQLITTTEDIGLIRRLIGPRRGLCILETFCGTGRILIPLALDGHTVVGMDHALAMLSRAKAKVRTLPPQIQERITLLEADVLQEGWPRRFDLAILGATASTNWRRWKSRRRSSPRRRRPCGPADTCSWTTTLEHFAAASFEMKLGNVQMGRIYGLPRRVNS